VPAKRNNVNRVSGTLETKPILLGNKEFCRSFLIKKFILAIKEKWPGDEICNPIFIQQDNARCHINLDGNGFCHVAKED